MSQFGIPLSKYFPLRTVPQDILESLCRSLWEWEDCPKCVNTGVHSDIVYSPCPWSVRLHLEPFRLFYKDVTRQYTPEDRYKYQFGLQGHTDLLGIVRFIQTHPQKSRKQLCADYFGSNGVTVLTDANKNQAFDLALSILSMIPFAENNLCLDRNLLDGPETWVEHLSAYDAVAEALPIGEPLSKRERHNVTQNVSAAILERHGLRIISTDDFRQHLEYDSTASGVYVFFHPGFLRGHLSFLRSPAVIDTKTVLSQQVVLETLYTLQHILFVWEDTRNSVIASKMGFDLTDLEITMSNYSGLGLDSKQYQYWGKRLLLLVDVLEDAKKKRRMQACARRYRRTIYVATMALTLVVAVVSAVIGPWMQSREGASDVVIAIARNGTALTTTRIP